MTNPFNPGYYQTCDLLALGFCGVGENVKIAKNATLIGLKNIFLGSNVRIDGFTSIIASSKGQCIIGSNVHIGSNCFMSCAENIILSDFSGLSHGVKIYTKSDDYSGKFLTNPTVPEEYTSKEIGSVTLGKHVIVGSNSVILPGVTIGEGSAVGALSLVTKNLGEWGVFFGSPAKHLKKRSKDLLMLEKKYIGEE